MISRPGALGEDETPCRSSGRGLVVLVATVAWIAWNVPPASAGSELGVTILVNSRARMDIVPGTPLIFEIALTGSPSSRGLDVGSRWRPWYELIHLEDARSRAPLTWTLKSAEPPRSLSVVESADGRPEITTEVASDLAHLEAGRQVHTITEAVSPDVTSHLTPGIYRVHAVLETPVWLIWGWRGRIVSGPVIVTIADPTTAGNQRAALEAERLTLTSDYYLRFEQFEDAERVARELVQSAPTQANGEMLLGDALAGLNRREDALAAYRRALTLVPPSYEEPRP